MSEQSGDSEVGQEGLLTLEGRIFLFLYREGDYVGTKAEFARVIRSSPSRVDKELEKLGIEGLVTLSSEDQGFKLTKDGKVRIRQFVVPRELVIVSLVLSFFVFAEGFYTVFLRGPLPSPLGLLIVGVIFVVYSVILVRYYFATESRILKGKPRSKK